MTIHRQRAVPVSERIANWIDGQRSREPAPTLWWLACLGFGIVTLAIAFKLQSAFPASGAAMPAGYGAPVLAFEFAQNQNELIAIFGSADDPAQPARLAAMQSGNEQDFLFMLFYAMFLSSGGWALWRELRRPILLLAVVMPVLAALFDAWENWLLFAIQTAFVLGEFAPEIQLLAAPVTAKFLLLTATNVLIGYALSQVPGRGWQLVGVLVIVPCVATVMALIAPIAFAWTLAPVIAAGWIALLLAATIASWRAVGPKTPLANFKGDDLAKLQRRRSDRKVAARSDQSDHGLQSPPRPATFGRRRTDLSDDTE